MRHRWTIVVAFLVAFATPALAADYPVQGRFGVSVSDEKGAIECHGRRVIRFFGNQRTDNKGGVPAFRNVSVSPEGRNGFQVVDEFSTGQITNGRVYYGLRQIDADRVELRMQSGEMLKLQRCK